MSGASMGPTQHRKRGQWSRIASMRVPGTPTSTSSEKVADSSDTAKICLANHLRPGRLYAEVPVRQEDLNEMIPDDWRRLQRESAGESSISPLLTSEPLWGGDAGTSVYIWNSQATDCPARLTTRTFPGSSPSPTTRYAEVDQDRALIEPYRFDSESSSYCGGCPVIVEDTGIHDNDGEASGSESGTPTTPAFELDGWLDDLRDLMSRQSRPKRPINMTPDFDPSPVIQPTHHQNPEASMLVTIVEADEDGNENNALSPESTGYSDRSLGRRLSNISDLEPIEELEETEWDKSGARSRQSSGWARVDSRTPLKV